MLKPSDIPTFARNPQALDTIQAPPDKPELQPRGWWTVNSDETVYYHLPETMKYLKNYLKDERFDVSTVLSLIRLAVGTDLTCREFWDLAKDAEWLLLSPSWYATIPYGVLVSIY